MLPNDSNGVLAGANALPIEGEAFLRLVTDHLPVRVAYVDRDYRFRFLNDAYLAQVGLSRERALGRTLAETLGEPMFLQARPNLDRAWTARDSGLLTIRMAPFLDPLRGDPRFKAIVAKLDFP